MAALVHLRKEERVGLGVAAGAHVALLVAILVMGNREQPTIPMPERMTVSLAQDVGMEDTAPDPATEPRASVSPILSQEPSPDPQPEAEAPAEAPPVTRPVVKPEPAKPTKPTSKPKPEAKPQPKPKPEPKPKPQQKAEPKPAAKPVQKPKKVEAPSKPKSSGSRIGSDFLAGSSANADGKDSGAAASQIGPQVQASLGQAITRQLKPHWSAPQGADAEQLVTIIRFRLNRDGSLAGNPEVVSQSGVTPSNQAQKARHAEQAIRAVRLAAPFDLPERFYDGWKVVTSQFDRRLSQ